MCVIVADLDSIWLTLFLAYPKIYGNVTNPMEIILVKHVTKDTLKVEENALQVLKLDVFFPPIWIMKISAPNVFPDFIMKAMRSVNHILSEIVREPQMEGLLKIKTNVRLVCPISI